MSNLNSVMKLKSKIKKLEREKAKAQGGIEQQMKTLRERFGCSMLEEAKELLRQKTALKKQLANEHKKQHSAFVKKWSDYVEAVE